MALKKKLKKSSVLVKFDHGKVTIKDWRMLMNLYGQTIKKNEKGFFIGIANYIKFVSEHKALDDIAKTIKQAQTDDEKKLLILEKKLRQQVHQTEGELRELVESTELSNNKDVKESLNSLDKIRDGRIQSSATLEEALYGAVAGVIMTIFNIGKKELIKGYIIPYTDTDNIAGYKFAPIYTEYKEELKNFRDKRKTSVWGAWDKLVLVYLVIHKKKEQLDRLNPVEEAWKRLNFVGLVGEMDEIIDEKRGHRIEFIKKDYEIYFDKVHNYINEKTEGADLERIAEQTIKVIKDFSSFDLPQRVVNDMKQAAELASKFNEQYKLFGATVIEPLNRMNQFGDRLRESVKSANRFIEPNKGWFQNLELISAPILPRPTYNFEHLKNVDSPNELLKELVQVSKEILVEQKTIKNLLIGGNNQVADEVTREPAIIRESPSKKAIIKYLNDVSKRCALSPQQKRFLFEISDLEFHLKTAIEKKIGVNDIKSTVSKLNKKIKREKLSVIGKRGGFTGKKLSGYTLKITETLD